MSWPYAFSFYGVTFKEDVVRAWGDTFVLSDLLVADISAELTIADTLVLKESWSRAAAPRGVDRNFGDTLFLSDALTVQVRKVLGAIEDILVVTDAWSRTRDVRAVDRTFGDTLSLGDAISHERTKLLETIADTLNLIDAWSRTKEPRAVDRTFGDTLGLSDEIAAQVRKVLDAITDALAITDSWGRTKDTRAVQRAWDEVLSLTSDLSAQVSAVAKSISDTLSLTDSWSRSIDPRTPESDPYNVTATSTYTAREIGLTWQDDSSNTTDWRVRRRVQGTTTWTTIASSTSGTKSYTDNDPNLIAGETYEYGVQGYNSAGSSNWSGAETHTTPAAPFTPTNFSGLWRELSCEMSLSWDDMANTALYRVWRGSTVLGTTTGTSYLDGDVNENTQYTWYVRGESAWGNSSQASHTATTGECGGIDPG